MSSIAFEINVENIDFDSKNFERVEKHIKKFEIRTDHISKNEIDGFITKISHLIVGWYRLAYNYYVDNYYIVLTLMFQTKEFSQEQQELVGSIVNECSQYFISKEKDIVNTDNVPNDNVLESDGFIISYSNDEEAVAFLSYDKIEEILRANNVDCKTFSVDRTETFVGAGSAFENFMIFVFTSVQSGITWDIIKATLSKQLGVDFDNIKVHVLDNVKFKILRRTVADRIKDDPKSLELISFRKDSKKNKIFISMKCRDKRITLICDNNYSIIELSVE